MALPKLENPKHSCVLPSTQKTVYYRPFLVGEQKVLLMAQESEDQNTQVREMIRIINTCCDDITAHSLPAVDLEYLFVQMRIKSVGETSDVLLPCTSCSVDNELKINLESLEVVKADKEVSNIVKLTPNVSLDLMHPTYEIMEKMDANKAQDPKEIFSMIAKCIVSIIEGDEIHTRDDFTEKELNEFLDSMSMDMFENVQLYFNSAPTLHIKHNFKCTSCGHENHVDLQGVQNFFG